LFAGTIAEYTANEIENLNKKIRRATKNKLSFKKEDRLIDYVFIVINFEEMKYKYLIIDEP
jgi:transposase-like protein